MLVCFVGVAGCRCSDLVIQIDGIKFSQVRGYKCDALPMQPARFVKYLLDTKISGTSF